MKTPETFDELVALIDAVKGLQKGDKLLYEIENLYSMQEWALEQQPVQTGDNAFLNVPINFANAPGWKPYEEALQPGVTGIVTDVKWNGYHKYWGAGFKPDELWSTSDFGDKKRYDHPGSRTFTVNVEKLCKVEEKSGTLPPQTPTNFLGTPPPNTETTTTKQTPKNGQKQTIIEYYGGPLHGRTTTYPNTQKDLQCLPTLKEWDHQMDYAIYRRVETNNYPNEIYNFWGLASGKPWETE